LPPQEKCWISMRVVDGCPQSAPNAQDIIQIQNAALMMKPNTGVNPCQCTLFQPIIHTKRSVSPVSIDIFSTGSSLESSCTSNSIKASPYCGCYSGAEISERTSEIKGDVPRFVSFSPIIIAITYPVCFNVIIGSCR
jgi:hypothetical protein